jgi:hypothetical protein
MPTRYDILTPSLKQLVNIELQGYVDGVNNVLLRTDPAKKLEPGVGGQTTETTRFTVYVPLLPLPASSVYIVFTFWGTMHIYENTPSTTYYYKLYTAISKTTDFNTFTDLTTEKVIGNYSRGASSTAGWYDEGAITGVLTGKVNGNDGDVLCLKLRGTSWNDLGTNTSIGLNSTNTQVAGRIVISPI